LGPIKIALDCRTGIQLNSDPKLLSRILENLLLNSLEAGGDKAAVNIKVSTDVNQGQAIIEVTDSGPGIPTELLPDALFEPYRTAKPKGSGIGLWQVSLLVKSLKGTVWAENTAEGGARFMLRLPLAGIENDQQPKDRLDP
jgi:signal transduction histidine kinase